jgi:hypothetical protein
VIIVHSMPQRILDSRCQQDEVHLNPQWTTWLLKTLVDLRELPPTLVCSAITTVFTLHAEGTNNAIHVRAVAALTEYSLSLTEYRAYEMQNDNIASERALFRLFEWVLHPSAAMMIWACVILGCSLSSFVFRHRRQDRFQISVFSVAIAWGILLGYGVGSSLNLIMLGFVPWSLAVAVLLSGTGHSFGRFWCHRYPEPYPSDGKERILAKV